MAHIDIEKKKGGAGWLWWLVGLIVIGLLAWLLIGMMGRDGERDTAAGVADTAAMGTEAGATGQVPPAALADFTQQCAMQGDMGVSHEYTANCTTLLARSIDAVVQRPELRGTDLQAELTDLRARADRLTSTQSSTEHANMTREAFVSATTLLERAQSAGYPELKDVVADLRKTAESLRGDRDLLSQRDTVHEFFERSGEVLRVMARVPSEATNQGR